MTPLQSDLEFLADELRRLHTQWDCFEQLFLAPGRRELRSHAGHLLSVLDVALATDIVMTVSRLCDPVSTMGRENLVFDRFLSDFPQLRPSLWQPIQTLRDLYAQQIKPIRNWRLAHNSLRLLRGQDRARAPQIKAIRGAIELCTDIVSTLYCELNSVAISMVSSFVPGEVDWIEASLRHVESDRIVVKAELEAVRHERLGESEG